MTSDNNKIYLFIMEYKKISNGNYTFKGIDTFTGKEIQGNIICQKNDIELSKSWKVIFDIDTREPFTAYFGKSLKDCKNWLK